MPDVTPADGDLAAQLDRVRLESDTLYGIIAVIASAPGLRHVLDGVVDLLTRATRCHACFVYLRAADRLRLRAASQVYAQFVGTIEFGIDEGLAGWAVRHGTPAFIRDNARDDPRTNYVPELEEERFQSMAAVPIPSRGGQPIGVIVLHTVAPHEFEERTLNLLVHTAPLLAGAIENAKLYEDARQRVQALTDLTELSQRIAAVQRRADLYAVTTAGVRALLRCPESRFYELDEDQRVLRLVASARSEADPQVGLTAPDLPVPIAGGAGHARYVREALDGCGLAVDVLAGDRQIGVLAACHVPEPSEADEGLLRAVANQVAVAFEKAELIERLTEENLMRDLFAALEAGRGDDAAARARRARLDLDDTHVIVHARAAQEPHGEPWPARATRLEARLRRLAPDTHCDIDRDQLRALIPLAGGGEAAAIDRLDAGLAEIGRAERVAIGRSEAHRGAADAGSALREAADASQVAHALKPAGGALPYRDLGAYRYLVHVAPDGAPPDPYLEAVVKLREYDARRGTQLVATLEAYLAERRSVTDTARALIVHPNTLRQRLDRIEQLTGRSLASSDLLALALAVKLAHLTAGTPPQADRGTSPRS